MDRDDHRQGAARTIPWPACGAHFLQGDGRASRTRPRLPAGRGCEERPGSGDPVELRLAHAIRRRQLDRRQPSDVQWLRLHRDRRAAGWLRERDLANGADVRAHAVRRVRPVCLPHLSSSARDRAAQARRVAGTGGGGGEPAVGDHGARSSQGVRQGGTSLDTAARDRDGRRAPGAVRDHGRGGAGAAHRVRERDEPAPGARRAAEGGIRDARRARREPVARGAAVAHREHRARAGRRRARRCGGRAGREGAYRAEPGGAAASGPDRAEWEHAPVRVRAHDRGGRGVRHGAGAARVAERPARPHQGRDAARGGLEPQDPRRARGERSGARADAAHGHGAAAAERDQAAAREPGLRRRATR